MGRVSLFLVSSVKFPFITTILIHYFNRLTLISNIRLDEDSNSWNHILRVSNRWMEKIYQWWSLVLQWYGHPHVLGNPIPKNLVIWASSVMYRSNRSFYMPPPHPPGIWLFWKLLFTFPPTRAQNAVQMPHTRVHSGDQMPPPRGHFTGTKMTEGRWKRLQLSNKIFINITKTVTTNKKLVQSGRNRCYKVTECSAFLHHATYKGFYKKRSHLLRLLHHDHFTDMHHRSPYKLTYLQ